MPEPFEDALQSLRTSLQRGNVRVSSELDVSRRIAQSLGVRPPRCRILYVWPSASIATGLPPEIAVALPLHIVVASHGERTDIYVQSRVRAGLGGTKHRACSIILATQAQILQVLEEIAMRAALV